jgi:hypothetical protein
LTGRLPQVKNLTCGDTNEESEGRKMKTGLTTKETKRKDAKKWREPLMNSSATLGRNQQKNLTADYANTRGSNERNSCFENLRDT